MLTNERIEQILQDSGALLTGHFLLTSGRHSDRYMQCAKILQSPAYATELVSHLHNAFKDDAVDIVISPAVGGIVIGYELARQLGATSLFAERENGVMTLRRGFAIPKGARVVVAEDVITTGGSVREVIDIVKNAGGVLAGVALLVDRSGGGIDFGAKTVAAYTTAVTSYEADNCPICAAGDIPLTKPGSRNTP
ncbi:MAG: orotate phosphoribosyltransferase [Clostridiales bacterium]|jgi:orotate phosphoribosyltransferase|nr:orotate phosphoribosyltransferase [Clostridiales bacterium]